MRISDWSSDVCSSDLVDRAVRLHRRNRMLVDELHLPFALQQHAEQIEGDDIALQHDAVDEEHGDRFVRAAHGVEKDVLECLALAGRGVAHVVRSEEHTSELQSLMRITYAVFCLKKKN